MVAPQTFLCAFMKKLRLHNISHRVQRPHRAMARANRDGSSERTRRCRTASHTTHGGIPNDAWRHPKLCTAASETAQRPNDGKPRRRQSKTILEVVKFSLKNPSLGEGPGVGSLTDVARHPRHWARCLSQCCPAPAQSARPSAWLPDDCTWSSRRRPA